MSELYLFDNAERLLSVTNPTEAVQSEELNKMITFQGIIPYSDTMRKVQYIGHKDADDSNNFHLYRLTNNKPEGLSKVPITGVHTFFDDMSSDGYIKDYRPTNKTVLEIVTKILDGSRWKVGVVQTSQRATTNFYYLTRLDSLSKLVDLTGVEIRPRMVYSDGKITSRYLDVYDRLGADRGKIFQHGVDLLTVTENNNLGAIYTAAVGRGRGEETESGFGRKLTFADVEWSVANGNPVNKPVGQEYVELVGQTKLYGFANGTKPRIAIIDFSDEEDQEKLLTSTYDWLVENSRPKTEYSSTVARAGDCKLGDTVGISKPCVGIKYKTRIFKIERNLLNRNKTKFGIGDKLTKSSYEREKFLVNQIEQAKDDTVYWLDSLKKQIVSSYFNEDGYNYDLKAGNEYGLPAGYYSFDKPIDQDPSKVIYMGAGKLAIANSKLPTGEWNWTTMATGDGMTLDAVNSGVLTSGRIQSPDGKSYWDLDNGDVVLNVNKLTINANPVATQKDLEAIELTQGPAGKGIVSTELRYLLTSQATGVTRNAGVWGTVVQTPTATQRYVWAYRIERYSDGTSTTGEPYVLSVFGEKGEDGAQGIPGAKGADGRTPYFHRAWANSADGRTGFSTTDSTDKRYLGTLTDFKEADSQDPTQYKWTALFDNVQVGGRNLFYNSQNVKQGGYYNQYGAWAASAIYSATLNKIVIDSSESYTLQAWGKKSTWIGIVEFNNSDVFQKYTTLYLDSDGYVNHVIKPKVDGYVYISYQNNDETLKIKLERGNLKTDYTVAPEDTQADIDSKADNVLTQEQLNLLSEQAELIKADLESKASLETVSEVLEKFQNFQKMTRAEWDKSEKTIIDHLNRIVAVETNLGQMAQKWNAVDSFMQYSEDGLSLGKKDGSASMLISPNGRITIYSNGKPAMYMDGTTVYIENGIFTKSVQIGEFREEPYHLNPSMNVIRWVGKVM